MLKSHEIINIAMILHLFDVCDEYIKLTSIPETYSNDYELLEGFVEEEFLNEEYLDSINSFPEVLKDIS